MLINVSIPDPEQGVYEFPRLTLLGFDTNEPQVRRLTQLGLKVSLTFVVYHQLPLTGHDLSNVCVR